MPEWPGRGRADGRDDLLGLCRGPAGGRALLRRLRSSGGGFGPGHAGAPAAGRAGYNDQALATLHWRKGRSLTAGLAPSPEATQLGITAAVMILAPGWRLGGLSGDGGQFFEDEAIQIYAEGRRLAESIGSGNEPMLAALVMG